MADSRRTHGRAHSPDVLAELLGTDVPPSPMPDLQPNVTSRRTGRPSAAERRVKVIRQASPETSPSALPAEVAPAVWENEVVTFQEHRGWRVRYVNGAELPNWLAGSLVHEYLQQRGAEGWEIAGVSTTARFYGAADGLQVYFKRKKV